MYDFTFRLNLLFLNKDKKKRGIHNAQFLAEMNYPISNKPVTRLALLITDRLWTDRLKTF